MGCFCVPGVAGVESSEMASQGKGSQDTFTSGWLGVSPHQPGARARVTMIRRVGGQQGSGLQGKFKGTEVGCLPREGSATTELLSALTPGQLQVTELLG